MKNVLVRFIDLFSSLKLTVVILGFMFLVTLLGTIVQETRMSLFDAQRTYFESWLIVQPIAWGINAPLPGGVTLMALLALNLLCGGIVRLRHSWQRAGILVTHVGIAFLLVAGLVKFVASVDGHLALYEGQESAEYTDSYGYEIAVMEPLAGGKAREYTFPAGELVALGREGRLTLRHADLPFDLELHGWTPNARIAPGGPVDDCRIDAREPALSANERNIPACYATARVGTEAPQHGILWALDSGPPPEIAPWTVTAGARRFGVKLRATVRPLPFKVRVDDFRADFHPGVMVAKSFASDVTLFDGDAEPSRVRIEMNAPLRRDGFILFQSSWGPEGGGPDDRLFTVFSVVSNPSDHWPTIACCVIGAGLVLHFGWMLIRHIQKERAAWAG